MKIFYPAIFNFYPKKPFIGHNPIASVDFITTLVARFKYLIWRPDQSLIKPRKELAKLEHKS